ncbi:hypothetical protein BHE74_00030980 [Ensete ventricosum]|nr:hypothetical protein BHE74_00030980 [Ensete ventricosum]RZR84918.1 hypothetical protein BHM03_00011810 [Ensete ventricosum]
MSSATSHFESQSVKLSTHRSRVLSRPSGDFVSVAIVPSTNALGDLGTADALPTMRSFFNVDSTVTTRQLVEVRKNYFIPLEYELHVPLSGERPYDIFLGGFCNTPYFPTEWTSWMVSSSVPTLSADETELVEILWGDPFHFKGVGDAMVTMVEKHPSFGTEAGLRKRLWKAAVEQPADASGSTTRTFADKGKGMVELGEVPVRGYTMRDLCKVEDPTGANRYFASIMTRLKCVEGEDPLASRWSTISGSSPLWTEGMLSEEYLRGALHPTLTKQVYECSSEELMNHAGKSAVWELAAAAERRAKGLEAEIEWMRTELESLRSQRMEFEQEVGLLRTSLDGARNDRARLEGDVLSLTEAAALLEAELKAKGPKVVATYKASRGFKSDLEKMGTVSYEFEYQVTLE